MSTISSAVRERPIATLAIQSRPNGALGLGGQVAVTMILVGLATTLAFVVEHLIAAPNLTLIFVLPVVVAATFFGWVLALLAAVTGVLAFDYFFTAPYYSLRIASASDLWAAGLLFVIGAIVSTVAAEGRRRAMEARRAAERAQAVQALAHTIIEGRPRRDVLQAGAEALHRIFRAPAVVLVEEGGGFPSEAAAGGAEVTGSVRDAARGVLDTQVRIRGETFPYDHSPFDLWPLVTPAGRRLVLGVDFAHGDEERPSSPDPFVDVVGGYLAAALKEGR